MKFAYTYILLAVLALGSALSLRAQTPTVDICLSEKNATTLAVNLNASSNFTGIVSNLQFTIRWDGGTNATLANPTFIVPTNAVIAINKAGAEAVDGGKHYQKFFSGNFSPMTATGQQLSTAPLEVLEIQVVDGTGTALPITSENFVIGSDAFTNNISFNGVYYAELNGGDRTGTIVVCSPQNLPVELLTFEANKVNDHDVLVAWVTEKEVNNDYFVVEKKRNNGEFAPIGRVKGQGTTEATTNYEFLDESGMANVVYYRLKQFDLDGSFTYSDIVEVGFEYFENDKFVVFPSPARSTATLQATGQLDGDYSFTISDAAGKLVHKGLLVKDAPKGSVDVDVSEYAEGVYFIRLVSPKGKSYLNRLVKIN